MTDPLLIVADLAPHVDSRPELIQRARSELMETIDASTRPDTTPPRRRRRRWAIPVAIAAAVTVGAGWALLSDSADSTRVVCPGNDVISAVTGDPVLDCANEWRRLNDTEPPAMVAYDNGQGGVVVLAAGDIPSDQHTALDPGPYQDTLLIELEAALDDLGSGLGSGCYDAADATEITRSELGRLGLEAWGVTVDPDRRPDGATTCAHAVVQPDQQQVQLIGVAASNAVDPYQAYATALDAQLGAACMTLDQAADAARALAADTDIVIDGTRIELTEEAGVLVIHMIEEPDAACTRADVNVGGLAEVTLRGPSD